LSNLEQPFPPAPPGRGSQKTDQLSCQGSQSHQCPANPRPAHGAWRFTTARHAEGSGGTRRSHASAV